MQSVNDILIDKMEDKPDYSEVSAPASVIAKHFFKNFFYVTLAVLFLAWSLFYVPKSIEAAPQSGISQQIIKSGSAVNLTRSGTSAELDDAYGLKTGDEIETDAESTVEIYLSSGAILRLDNNTKIAVLDSSRNDLGRRFDLEVKAGRIWINNTLERDQFRVFSKYVSAEPVMARFEFGYDPNEEEVTVLNFSGAVLISFLSKQVPQDQNRSEVKADMYLNQLALPEQNQMLISESTITDNFLQAKYLKLLKSVKISPIVIETKEDWLANNQEKDQKFALEYENLMRTAINNRRIDLTLQQNKEGFWSSLEKKLLFFPQKKQLYLKNRVATALSAAEKALLDGNVSSGEQLVTDFKNAYLELQNSDWNGWEVAMRPLIMEEFFRLNMIRPGKPLYSLKRELGNFVVAFINEDAAKLKFSTLELKDYLLAVSQLMKSAHPNRAVVAKQLLKEYKKELLNPKTKALLSKLPKGTDYLIQERHMLLALFWRYSEFFDKELFQIAAEIEDLVTAWSPGVTEEDDNRLFFRAQNLDLFGALVVALKNNQGSRVRIGELGYYLIERNQDLNPPGTLPQDKSEAKEMQEEFLQIVDYIESDFFKGKYVEEDYKAYLRYAKNLEEYTGGGIEKTKRKVKNVNLEALIEQVKKDFQKYGYKASEISSLADSEKLLFIVEKIVVRGKVLKGNYNLEKKYVYDIEYEGDEKSGEVPLSLLYEVVKEESERPADSDKPASNQQQPNTVERYAVSKVISDLQGFEVIALAADIQVVNLDKHEFFVKKAVYGKSTTVEFRFRYFDDKKQGDNLEVKMKDGKYKKISMQGDPNQLAKKAYQVSAEENIY